VGEAIAADQVLSAKVLKLVNSAFYGFPGRVNTITHAIVILGFSSIKNIVLTTGILGAFNLKSKAGGFDLMAFWKHSVATGVLAQLVAKEARLRNPDVAFISGLLHDIGKLVLALYATKDFNACMELAAKRNGLFYDAEMELLGVSHAEVGGFLKTYWNLPPDIASVMELHHQSPQAAGENAPLVAAVQLADLLARSLCLGHPCDATVPILSEEAWSLLNLNEKSLDNVLDQVEAAIQNAGVFTTLAGD
jgi:HD-like signal output (HDOD) protein